MRNFKGIILFNILFSIACSFSDPLSAADFCTDLNAVLSRSGSMSDIAGAAKSENDWIAKLQVSGFPECVISRGTDQALSYHCYGIHSASKAEARNAYEDIKKAIGRCLPGSDWFANEMTGGMISYFTSNPGKGLSVGLSIFQNADMKQQDGDTILINVWYPTLTILPKK